MGKSIRTTSNTQTTTNSTPATFKAGDAVLCPSIGHDVYTLHPNGSDKGSKRLVILIGDDYHSFCRDGRIFPTDALPSLFHDTQANRQAIATLYSGSQTSQRTVIDITEAADNEVILIPSIRLSDIACDLTGAITVLNDIGALLHLIYKQEITPQQARSMARLSHDATDTWATVLYEQLESINDTLAMTGYSKEGKQ